MSEYIEREALVKYFQERFDWLRKASEKPVGGGNVIIDTELQTGAIIAKEFLDKAKAAATADVVEVRHGGWVVENEHSIRCSECCFNRASIKMPLNYCPCCGAKMDGKGE